LPVQPSLNSGSPLTLQQRSDALCPMARKSTYPLDATRRRVGSISDGGGHKYNLFSRPETTKSSTTMAEVYNHQSTLSNRARVNLALMLAWGVLQISSTSWMKGAWTKDNILIVMDTPNKPLPYLSHRFESSRIDSMFPTPMSTLSPPTIDQVGDWVNNTSIFSLGIFLLEMCHNCPIEDLATKQEKNENGKSFETGWGPTMRRPSRHASTSQPSTWTSMEGR
jgi:hypothetical protein